MRIEKSEAEIADIVLMPISKIVRNLFRAEIEHMIYKWWNLSI